MLIWLSEKVLNEDEVISVVNNTLYMSPKSRSKKVLLVLEWFKELFTNVTISTFPDDVVTLLILLVVIPPSPESVCEII